MAFWTVPGVAEIVLVCILLLVARILRAVVSRGGAAPFPDSLLAGVLGLVVGPSLLGWVPFDPEGLEPIVYHGLAITFICFGLQPAQASDGASRGASVRGLTFALPITNFLQGILGLLFVLGWSAAMDPLHPGFGWLVTLGFAQGPGQALSIGHAFEDAGLANGGQLGLAAAGLGFAWAVVVGVPLIALGRRWGLLSKPVERSAVTTGGLPVGDLTLHVATIGTVYAATWLALTAMTSPLPPESPFAGTLWGFHFIVGLGLALAVRVGLGAVQRVPSLEPQALSRIAGLAVDITTTGALCALQLDRLADGWLPLLVLTGVGGAFTLWFSLWHASRLHRKAPFEHAVVFFGTMTGTLPAGLALLRTLDPELQSPAARNQVVATALALPLGAPLMVVIPWPVVGWPETFPSATWQTIGAVAAWTALLWGLWMTVGGFRIGRRWLAPWSPPDD